MRNGIATYGTASFDYTLMCEMIGWGEAVLDSDGYYVLDRTRKPTQLCFAIWLCIVPKVYRAQVVDITIDVGSKYMGQKATKALLEHLVSEILQKIRAEVEPIPFRCHYE